VNCVTLQSHRLLGYGVWYVHRWQWAAVTWRTWWHASTPHCTHLCIYLSYHINHIISYHIISYHMIPYHIIDIKWQNPVTVRTDMTKPCLLWYRSDATGVVTRSIETIFWLLRMHQQTWTRIKLWSKLRWRLMVQSWTEFNMHSVLNCVGATKVVTELRSGWNMNSAQAWSSLVQWGLNNQTIG